MTLRYICPDVNLCKPVLNVALDVYRAEYSKQKSRAIETARSIYAKQLETAQAQVGSSVTALQAYDAQHPRAAGSSIADDAARVTLQHGLDQAQAGVDKVKSDVAHLETATQVANGITGDMAVIDQPKMGKGLFGIPGLRSDNLKTDSVVFIACLVAAIAYLVLVAFLDRSVREPGEITSKLGKSVVTIPDFQPKRRWQWLLRRKAA
jgi:hypothetical protein